MSLTLLCSSNEEITKNLEPNCKRRQKTEMISFFFISFDISENGYHIRFNPSFYVTIYKYTFYHLFGFSFIIFHQFSNFFYIELKCKDKVHRSSTHTCKNILHYYCVLCNPRRRRRSKNRERERKKAIFIRHK